MPAFGWLWLDEVEVLNDSRTLANLQCNVGGVTFTTSEDTCPGLSLDPFSTPQWEPLDYASTETAPWYSSSIPFSADFLGFHVESFTLNSPIERQASERGIVAGGANIGRLHRRHREIQVELVLLATSDAGMQHGFDWLASQLAPADPCATASALIRLSCPDVAYPTTNLWELREVGVLDGPEWGDSPFKYAGCTARRASFTLAAGDPCRYSTLTTTPVDAESFALNAAGDCGTASTQVDFICPTEGLPLQRSCAEITSVDLGSYAVDFIVDAGADGAAATLVRGAYNPRFKFIDGLTAAVGEYVATQGLTNLNTATSMVLAFALNLDDWSPAVGGGIGGYYNGANAACSLTVLSNGRLQATVRQSNGTVRTATSTVAVPFTDGGSGWVSCFIDVAAKTVTFYTADLDFSILSSQFAGEVLGTPGVAVASWDGTWISATTAIVGATNNIGAGIPGKVYRGFSIINGSLGFSPDIQDQTPGATTWVDNQGKTWGSIGAGVDISEPAGAYSCGDPLLAFSYQAVICRLAANERVWIDSTNRQVWYDSGDGVWVDGTDKMWLRGADFDHFFSFRSATEDFLVWAEPANLQGFSTTQTYTIDYVGRICQ